MFVGTVLKKKIVIARNKCMTWKRCSHLSFGDDGKFQQIFFQVAIQS